MIIYIELTTPTQVVGLLTSWNIFHFFFTLPRFVLTMINHEGFAWLFFRCCCSILLFNIFFGVVICCCFCTTSSVTLATPIEAYAARYNLICVTKLPSFPFWLTSRLFSVSIGFNPVVCSFLLAWNAIKDIFFSSRSRSHFN